MSAEPVAATGTRLPTGHWHLLPDQSTASFQVANLGFRTVTGTIPLREGSAHVDAAGELVGVRAVLDLDGLDTGSWRRDADLRKPHLLDTDRHPELTFEGAGLAPAPEGWRLEGRLGCRGTSAPVQVAVRTPDPGADPVELHLDTELDRRDLGLRVPRLLIGQRVRVTLVTRWRRG